MWKGKPVVGGDVGGIRLQIEDGVNGYLVDGVHACAERVTDLLADPVLRAQDGRQRAANASASGSSSLREIEDYLGLRLMADVT